MLNIEWSKLHETLMRRHVSSFQNYFQEAGYSGGWAIHARSRDRGESGDLNVPASETTV